MLENCTRTVVASIALGLVFDARLEAQNPPVTVSIDASAERREISPLVYGVAYGTAATLADLNAPINRLGGNNTSRYNWQVNADNRGNDWYFESIAYTSAAAGEVGDTFIASSEAAGAAPMVTIPMVGWVARVGSGRTKLASFSIAKYGPQSGNDWQWFPDAGNGLHLDGSSVAGNDPNDSNVPANSLFQKGWAQHLLATWGSAYATGLGYYILDNEPSIWHSTHRDIHPVGATMQEIRDKAVDYATTIKSVDPSAAIVGPEEWGWSGYFLSGYDQQYGSLHGWSNLPDRAQHGGADYLPWWLDQIRQASNSAGLRLLDVFSVHYYPQSGEFSDDTSSAMQLLRNRSTRSLWDPSYVDESWINDTVQLIPRLKNWVSTSYPGTRTAITEYNWGAEGHINGATTQADILGIFGREGLDLATRWTTPDPSTPTYKAIQLYRNYDGKGSAFGDVHVGASAPDPDTLSAFAAERRWDGALTIMVVHKRLSGNTPVTLSLAGFAAGGKTQVWQLTSTNAITRLADLPVSSSSVSMSVPPQSVTLFVIPAASGLSFYTLTPCRVVDTRGASGPGGAPAMPFGSNRTFHLAGLCGISPTAVAVSLNLTVTSPASAGSLTFFPDGSTLAPTNSMSFRAGQTRANNSVMPLGTTGGVTLHAAFPTGTAQVIIDVNGYFE
jgi:hypothetical protein